MISVFELFKIGIGPSSSHTVGPMKAAAAFAKRLVETGAIERVAAVDVALLGSLAFTGRGHATDKAVILGLSGETPDTVDLDAAEALEGGVGQGLDLLPVDDVGLQQHRGAALGGDPLGRLLGPVDGAAVVHADGAGALLGGAYRDLGAEAGAGAGDDDRPALEATR